MKIRLTQEGYEHFNGQMGVVFFENGVTTEDVKPIDAVRIAAQFLCQWEDGTTASVAQSLLDHSHATTFSIPQEMNADQAQEHGVDMAKKAAVKTTGYTKEQLAEIADKEGIKGLRAIGDIVGVKGNAILDLIDAILTKQD